MAKRRDRRARRRSSRRLRADVQELCNAMIRACTDPPGPDVDAAAAISRHGLDTVANYLTDTIGRGMTCVALKRGEESLEVIADEYMARFFQNQSDELRDTVRRQLWEGRLPPISEPGRQEELVWGLLTLHVATVIELAGTSPPPDVIHVGHR